MLIWPPVIRPTAWACRAEAIVVFEEIARSGAGFSGAQTVHAAVYTAAPIVRHGDDELKARLLPGVASGETAVQNVDREAGSVTVRLTGACSGCGISEMTVQAIETRMTEEIPEVEVVNASTAVADTDAPQATSDDPNGDGAPF